jgi:hypothetical protein
VLEQDWLDDTPECNELRLWQKIDDKRRIALTREEMKR